ncbi:MAG: 1-acyl-sn-glycerol-3-phosphate acyltransferase [Clostridia bacterium]|nr:1-acyl-sn-glycerol-3-phosphate acyltransferase [Clostridia bacterium]
MSFYSVARKCLGGFFRVFYRVKVTGLDNEPAEGPVVVCANHLSDHDVIILGACMKRQVRYFAKAELFKVPVLKQVIKALGAFPVDRKVATNAAASIKNTLQILENGEMIGLYPQGTRYPGVDPRTTPVKGGIGMIAYHSKATILPVCIYTKSWKIKLLRRTYVTVGKPITFEELGFTGGRGAEYQRASEYIFGKITDMIPESVPDPRKASAAEENDGN